MTEKVILGIAMTAVVATIVLSLRETKKEPFLGNLPSMQTKLWRSIGNQKGDLYSIPGQYQSILAPRSNFSVDYGANIRYNVPSYQNLGVPCDPLMMSDMVQSSYKPMQQQTVEGYCGNCNGGCTPNVCGQGIIAIRDENKVEPGYAAGNYNDLSDKVYANNAYPGDVNQAAAFPVGDMTSVNALGDVYQPIIYDRIVYANRNSRLRGAGDPIRGDLPIVPCGADWFRPSVQPNIDLQEGAMNVMGGIGNTLAQATAQLMYASSGGVDTTMAGVDMQQELQSYGLSMNNMGSQYATGLTGGMGDVNVTAYP